MEERQSHEHGMTHRTIHNRSLITHFYLQERGSHSCVLMDNGEVMVVGGHGNIGHLESTEFYDPNTDTWRYGPDLPFADGVSKAGLARGSNGNIFLLGGEGILVVRAVAIFLFLHC